MKPVGCSVLGWGAVTPNGWAMPPGAVGLSLTNEYTLSTPGVPIPVQKVSETGPVWERWKKEPRLRRASPISRFMVQSVAAAMEGAVPGRRRGLIGVFFTGALAYSRKFYEGCLKQGRKLASPALFPETVYNSPLSHVAAIMGFDGPSYSLVGDESSWAGAVATAEMWIGLGTVDEVVVVAAEELDPVSVEGIRAAGWLRRGYVPAEGASALRLGPPGGPEPRLLVAAEAQPFRNPDSCRAAAGRVFARLSPDAPLVRTARGLWSEGIENDLAGNRPVPDSEPGYAELGRSFAAGSGWAVILGLGKLGPEGPALHIPLFGSYHAVSALTLAKA